MKTISIFLALINSLLAGLLITFLISSEGFQISATWWFVLRILIALSVIVIGILTWIDGITQVPSGLIAASSISLVALGAGTIVWTFHRAQVTGDMEYYMVRYGTVQVTSVFFHRSRG
jgi:endonuclease/exonuclease/phosphatase (EEP) superfamily protein YafD